MNKTEKTLRKLFVITTSALVLSVLSGWLPALICWIARIIFVAVTVILSIVTIKIYFTKKKNLSKTIIILPIVVFIESLLAVFATQNLFVLFHEYTEVNRYFKNSSFSSYKILNIDKKNYNYGSGSGKKDSCNYVFNAKINDIIFQTGYCECGTMWTDYKVLSNYSSASLKQFYKDYKNNHEINFELTSKTIDIFNDEFTITYNNKIDEVYNFIKSYKDTYYPFAIILSILILMELYRVYPLWLLELLYLLNNLFLSF